MQTFDFNSIKDFDKHISLSIPNYEFLFTQVKMLVEVFAERNTSVVDVGCSTGRLIDSLEVDPSTKCLGIDSSNLINKVMKKNSQLNKRYVKKDFNGCVFPEKCSVVSAIFFLQFLGSMERQQALRKMRHCLNNKGVMIVCEKTYYKDTRLEHIFSSHYLEAKRKDFTDKAILDKNIKLAASMKLVSDHQLIGELSEYGDVSVFFKSMGFIGCVVRT